MAKKQIATVTELTLPAKKAAPRVRSAKHRTESAPATPQLESQEVIAKIAYGYWESRGGKGGNPVDDWFRAEAELRRIA